MAKQKNKDFDAASLNKQDYIRNNYIKKDESEEAPINKNQRMIITSMLAFLLLSLCAMFYWYNFMRPQNNANIQIEATPTATVEITPSPELNILLQNNVPTPRPILSKYDDYFDIYPDIVGWISIDNIKVDYPVIQSSNPMEPHMYLTLGPDQEEDVNGSIYLDIRNSDDAEDNHMIIYGHNMKSGAMFGQLNKYMTRSFYQNHLIIRYDTLYQELEWEVFNIFITTIEFDYIQVYFKSGDEFVDLMQQCISKSYYNNNTTVISPEDRVITLSTCTNGDDKDERFVVQARLITPLEGEEETVSETENVN